MEVVAAIFRFVIGVGVILALAVVLGVALAGVRPAVVLGMREAGYGFAVKGVEGVDPGFIIEVGGIGIARRIVSYFTTVLHAVQGGTKALEQLGAGSDQVDRSCGIAKRPCHRVWNVVRFTGLLRSFEDGCAGTVEHALDGANVRGLLAIGVGGALCRRKGNEDQTAQNRDDAPHKKCSGSLQVNVWS